ncbi:protein BUD31 homolog [Cyclopterus lumpus]|nr:protein BUD31 homolog [Cyclopterus lumpus]
MFIWYGDVIQATRRSNGPRATSNCSAVNGSAKSKRKHGELLFSIRIKQRKMPKVKRSRKPPPDGWELIEPTLDELDQKMREAETEPHEGKRKVESLWPIFRLHHQRSRYIYDLFYKRKAISRELYDYCIKEGYADKNLIAKWKKQGYENLCCLRCIQTRDTNFGTNCICRVPKSKLEVGRIIECTHCGCRGCSG